MNETTDIFEAVLSGTNLDGWWLSLDNSETALGHACPGTGDDGRIVAWYDGGHLRDILAHMRQSIATHDCETY